MNAECIFYECIFMMLPDIYKPLKTSYLNIVMTMLDLSLSINFSIMIYCNEQDELSYWMILLTEKII